MTNLILTGDYAKVLKRYEWDTCITDPPFSDRTHRGHDAGAAASADGGKRSSIPYAAWQDRDARRFVRFVAPRTRGWIVILTDHVLAPSYTRELERDGQFYVFAPLSIVEVNGRVQMRGDGPSCWVTWVVVARQRTARHAAWGALPGSYVTQGGERKIGQGGKPLSIMREIVRDYSRPSEIVCDPCVGWGTTAAAAAAEGRHFIGAELDPKRAELARGRARDVTPTLPGLEHDPFE